MNIRIKLLGIVSIYVIGALTLSSCGNSEDGHENHEHVMEDTHEHNGEEMNDHENMEMNEEIHISNCPKWEKGEHQHSIYVCPMFEEEGELEKAGECPKCGMTLVKFSEIKDQHDAQKQDSDDHDHEH